MNWRGLIFQNLGWKIFSLLIAVIVWSTYHISGGTFSLGSLYEDTTARDIPGYRPRLLTRQSDKHHYRLQPDEVRIMVSGRRENVYNMSVKDLVVYVDLQDFVADGETNERPVQVQTPAGIKLVNVEPKSVRITQLEPEFVPAD